MLRRPTPEEQSRITDVEGRSRSLARDAQKTAATDKAAAEKMNAESRTLATRARELRTALLTRPEIKTLDAQRDALEKDFARQVDFAILVNGGRVDTRGAASGAAAAGAAHAFSGPDRTILAW